MLCLSQAHYLNHALARIERAMEPEATHEWWIEDMAGRAGCPHSFDSRWEAEGEIDRLDLDRTRYRTTDIKPEEAE